MSWSVNDGDVVLGGLELPESNIDGDTTLSLGLELVKYPGIFERALSEFVGFLLELLDGSYGRMIGKRRCRQGGCQRVYHTHACRYHRT